MHMLGENSIEYIHARVYQIIYLIPVMWCDRLPFSSNHRIVSSRVLSFLLWLGGENFGITRVSSLTYRVWIFVWISDFDWLMLNNRYFCPVLPWASMSDVSWTSNLDQYRTSTNGRTSYNTSIGRPFGTSIRRPFWTCYGRPDLVYKRTVVARTSRGRPFRTSYISPNVDVHWTSRFSPGRTDFIRTSKGRP